jgi:RND family efflux system membrane fusion protein
MKGKKEYMKKGVIISLSIVALLIAIVAYRFLSTKQTQTVVYAPTVETAHIENKDIVLYTSQIATVEAAESVTIYPKMAGEILTLNKKLGDRVEQGEELASIKADTLEGLKIQMDQARIGMQDAQTNYTRTKALFDAAGVSQQVLEQAASASENAKLAYTAAKTQYDIQKSYSVIKAPIAGTVEKVGIEVHNIVSPQVEAFIVTADGGLTAKFGITSDSKEVLNVGDEITIQATGGGV